MDRRFPQIVAFVRQMFGAEGPIPLHAPVFEGRERDYVLACLDSTFVSSVGPFVNQFERQLANAVGVAHAVATGNGTQALHAGMVLVGVEPGDLVITQSLTFVATANAVAYCGAEPVFVDVDRETLGMSPDALAAFLSESAVLKGGKAYEKRTGRRIAVCVPVHVFGHPCRIDRIVEICERYGIPVVEDAAEALGSEYRGRACGGFGVLGVYSFNGNKIVTCGGGGALVTDDPEMAKRAKHLTTTAKLPHRWDYAHDQVGYNYRLPNLNAALACAQLERLSEFVASKRALAESYAGFFAKLGVEFLHEPDGARSNYWLNAVILGDRADRDQLLGFANDEGVQSRPCWTPLHRLPMFSRCLTGPLTQTAWLADRVVNLPSSFRPAQRAP